MKIRKAILTGGGRATRLYPVTTTINKHLLPLANKPMIFHAIEKVVEVGVKEIFINTNPGETDLQTYVGDGGHWGVDITFFEQPGGPQGIAHVVNEAKSFIGDDPFMFYLSDNILLGGVKEMVDEFNTGTYDCMLAFARVSDPGRFGVPIFDAQGKLVAVAEKPKEPPNNYAVTGIYLYGPKVYFDAFQRIERSARGEYEISDVHTVLLKEGKNVGYKEITGWWKDTGKPEDLLVANRLLLDALDAEDFWFHGGSGTPKSMQGKVHIGTGTHIGANVVLRGPVIIGGNCVLEDCMIGPYVTIGSGTRVRSAELRDSILLENCVIDYPLQIAESLIGRGIELRKRAADQNAHRMILGDKTIIEF